MSSDGHEVAPGITIPDDARQITINADGEVYASFLDRVEPELLGRITLVGFANDQGLEAIGSNLFVEDPPPPARPSRPIPGPTGSARSARVMWRPPSVDAVREITELIEAQRGL